MFTKARLKYGKIIKKTLVTILGIIFIFILSALIWINLFKKGAEIAKSHIKDFKPDMEILENGNYSGEFVYGLGIIKAKVYFRIFENRVTEFRFSRLSGTPRYGAPECVVQLIDSTKSININAISGATLTSNLAKAAIKDAIEKTKK